MKIKIKQLLKTNEPIVVSTVPISCVSQDIREVNRKNIETRGQS